MELKTYFAQDASGNIMPGATVTVYLANTTTLATGLQNEAGSPLANPFNADSSAKVAFYAPDGLYDILVVGNARTVTIRAQFVTIDGANILRADLAAPGGAALVGYGAGTVNDALDALYGASSVINIRDYGAALDGVTNDAAALLAANAAAAAAKLPLLIPGVAHIGTATTITAPLVDGLYQMLTPTSSVTINNGLPVRPDWFGSAAGNIRHAVDSLPATGGTVLLADKTYPPSYDTAIGSYFDNRGGTPGVDYMIKPHVRIQGTRLPEYNSDETQLVNGSIIQGMFYVSSECHGFQADLFGVDAGANVVAALYPAIGDSDGFCFLQTNKTVPVYGRNVHIGSVISLSSGLTSLGHGILLEAIDGGTVEYAEARRANHGVVIKSKNVTVGKLIGRRNHGDDVYLKADNYATLERVIIGEVVSQGDTTRRGVGVYIQAATNNAGPVHIGTVTTDDHVIGLNIEALTGKILADVQIGSLISRSHNTGYSLSGDVRKAIIGTASINNTESAVSVAATSTRKDNSIGTLSIDTATYGLDVSGKFSIGNLYSANVTTAAVYHRVADAKIYIAGGHNETAATFSLVTPALLNGWANFGGTNDTFNLDMIGGKFVLSGLIKSGTSGAICTLYANTAPTKALRFICLGYNGTVWAPVEILVDTAGNVGASNYTAASSYLSLRGVEWDIKMD